MPGIYLPGLSKQYLICLNLKLCFTSKKGQFTIKNVLSNRKHLNNSEN